MKISAINTFNYSQKTNNKKSNTNFGIKLSIHPNMQYFVMKDAMNLALNEAKPNDYYIKNFMGSFVKGLQGFAAILKDLEPKNMVLMMGLTPPAMKYISNPNLDGKLYNQQTKEKPVYLGFMNPMNTQSNLIAKPIDFPYTEVKAMENLEDVVNLADIFKQMTLYKKDSNIN